MTRGPFWYVLKARIESKVNDQQAALGNGRAADWPDYRHKVGYIEALNWVIAEGRDILGDDDNGVGRRPDEQDDDE